MKEMITSAACGGGFSREWDGWDKTPEEILWDLFRLCEETEDATELILPEKEHTLLLHTMLFPVLHMNISPDFGKYSDQLEMKTVVRDEVQKAVRELPAVKIASILLTFKEHHSEIKITKKKDAREVCMLGKDGQKVYLTNTVIGRG